MRVYRDQLTISLDCTGEHLHKRGYSIHKGEAPMRETLAAILATEAKSLFKGPIVIVDPFVGAGTLLFESASLKSPNFYREFAFFSFKNCPKVFKSSSWSKNYRWCVNQNQEVIAYGYDYNAKVLDAARFNKEKFESQYGQVNIEFELKDSKNLGEREVTIWKAHGFAIVLLANPPYGVRLEDQDTKEILNKLEDHVDGMVMVYPEKWNFQLKRQKAIKLVEFNNQGLKLKLCVSASISK